jgi:PAS domain-containing protein
MEGAFSLLAPLAVGIALALMLMLQSRRVETAQREFVDSEQRFRLAVEAARCGIWEWELSADQVFMSDVTGAMFGWGGGGVVPGQELLDRVSVDHRDKVRQALANAATYGAFDVSFRVPAATAAAPSGSTPAARASASPARTAIRGSSAWRWTSPRSAWPRPAPRPPRTACATPSRACRKPSCCGTARAGC